MDIPDRYLTVLLAALAVGLGGVGVVNATVDPAAVYDLPWTSGLMPYRSDLGSRTAKADAVAEGEAWDVVLLGTSRTDVGFDPADPAWDGDRVFNLGLPQSNVVETSLALDYLLAHHTPREVWLVVDLLAFGDGRRTSVDFSRSALDPSLDPVAYHADKLVGYSTLVQTATTVKNVGEGDVAEYDVLGHHRYRRRPGESARAGSLRWLERYLVNPATYGGFTYDAERMALLGRMVEQVEDAGADVVVVVSPVHASQLEVLRAAGLWDSFERFQRDLAVLGADRPVWDTTGYTGAPAEPLPATDADDFTWYWEPSHFRPVLGHLVIEAVRRTPPPQLPAVRLTPQTVEAHLQTLSADRVSWARANPDDVAAVEQIAACVDEWKGSASAAQTRVLGRTGNPGCARRP